MKVEIPFEKNPAEAELGVQNWVFLQPRCRCRKTPPKNYAENLFKIDPHNRSTFDDLDSGRGRGNPVFTP